MFEEPRLDVYAMSAGDPAVVLDGRCAEVEWRGSAAVELGAGVVFRAREDGDQVHLCIQPPTDGLGTLDIHLAAPTAGAPVNLHVSAQVGESVWTPAGWSEIVWLNYDRWYGTPVPLANVEAGPEGPRLRFAPGTARELTLDKSRFGPLPWRIRIEVRSLGPDRQPALVFPDGATVEDPDRWGLLRSPS